MSAPEYHFEEVDRGATWWEHSNYGPIAHYAHPKIEFDNTACDLCGAAIGPWLCEDDDHPRWERWRECFFDPATDILVCEDCAEEFDPTTKEEA